MGDKMISQKEKDGYKKIKIVVLEVRVKKQYYAHFEEIEIQKNLVFEHFERLTRAFTRSDRDSGIQKKKKNRMEQRREIVLRMLEE